jgi:hypothetical protein
MEKLICGIICDLHLIREIAFKDRLSRKHATGDHESSSIHHIVFIVYISYSQYRGMATLQYFPMHDYYEEEVFSQIVKSSYLDDGGCGKFCAFP